MALRCKHKFLGTGEINQSPKQKAKRNENKNQIDMMLGSTTMKVKIYSSTFKSVDNDFKMNTEVSKVQKP